MTWAFDMSRLFFSFFFWELARTEWEGRKILDLQVCICDALYLFFFSVGWRKREWCDLFSFFFFHGISDARCSETGSPSLSLFFFCLSSLKRDFLICFVFVPVCLLARARNNVYDTRSKFFPNQEDHNCKLAFLLLLLLFSYWNLCLCDYYYYFPLFLSSCLLVFFLLARFCTFKSGVQHHTFKTHWSTMCRSNVYKYIWREKEREKHLYKQV